MNGRYFAGKQITCEFVAVTRWKAAICGEFMRSRFKTCSHGVACNFIHCFRNPGGDYEWADWDNPPPKYWARKMTALFGSSPSDAAAYGKASNTPEFEWSQTSDRKRLRSSDDRYVSSGSRDGHAHPGHSSRDYSHSKQTRSRHRTKHEHNLHRREPSTANRQQGQEIGDNTGTMEKEKVPHTPTRAERYRSDHPDGGKRYDNNIRSRKHRSEHPETAEPGSSDRPSEFTNAGISKNDSGSTSVGRHSSRRQSLDDSSSSLKGHYSSAHKSSGKEHNTKRSSRRYIEDDSYDEKDDGRGKSRKDRIGEDSCDEKDGGRSKSRKDRIGDDCYDEKGGGRSKSRKDVCDDVDDRWLATNSDVDSDVEIQYRRSRSRDRESRKDNAYSHVDTQHQRSGSRTTKLGTKDDKITRTKKHHNESRRHNGSDEDTPDSTDLSSRTRSRSRSSEEDRSSHISRRKRSHRSHDS